MGDPELENIQRYITRRLHYHCIIDCNQDHLARINPLTLERFDIRRIYTNMPCLALVP